MKQSYELFRSPSRVHFEQGGSDDDVDEVKQDHQNLPSDDEDTEDEGHPQSRALKSLLLTKHFQKVKACVKKRGQPKVFDDFCNYSDKKYNSSARCGYNTFRIHIT